MPAKAKMKKTPQPFKRQLNCWKQLKLKPPTLCTRILDGPQKHRAPARVPEPRAQGHLRSQGKDYTATAHSSRKGAEVDLVLSWNQLGFFVLIAF